MATIERRNDTFRVIFYHAGRRYAAALKTTDPKAADAVAGSVERTLGLLRQGAISPPAGADFVQFVLSAGHQTDLPKGSEVRTFKDLKDRYLAALGVGAVEANTLLTIRIHLDHWTKTLGAGFPVQALARDDLQRHVTRRAGQKGRRGRTVRPATLKKEIASFRACWNWALAGDLVNRPFPNRGLKFPKAVEKPPFMTYAEIERKVAQGGLSAQGEADLWDALFLTLPEIDELLAHVRRHARVDWVYPMIVFAAHTGARRSELIRAKVADIDFDGQAVLVWERKKDKSRHTYRRVPLTVALSAALKTWLGLHPGGPTLFCHNERPPRSKKKAEAPGDPLTRKEVADHFARTLRGSKWEKLKGWHVLRHSFISNCATRVDLVHLDKWTEHQTAEMRDRYTHLIPSEERRAIASVFEPERE